MLISDEIEKKKNTGILLKFWYYTKYVKTKVLEIKLLNLKLFLKARENNTIYFNNKCKPNTSNGYDTAPVNHVDFCSADTYESFYYIVSHQIPTPSNPPISIQTALTK